MNIYIFYICCVCVGATENIDKIFCRATCFGEFECLRVPMQVTYYFVYFFFLLSCKEILSFSAHFAILICVVRNSQVHSDTPIEPIAAAFQRKFQ